MSELVKTHQDALISLGRRYESIFSANLGIAKKRCMIYSTTGELCATRDGMNIAQNLRWAGLNREKTIHDFIVRNSKSFLGDNSTSFFLLLSYVLQRPTEWDTIKKQLTSIHLEKPTNNNATIYLAIRNSMKIDLFPELDNVAIHISKRVQEIPKPILTYKYIDELPAIGRYSVTYEQEEKNYIFFENNMQFFPEIHFLDNFDERTQPFEKEDLALFFDVQNYKDLTQQVFLDRITAFGTPQSEIAPVEKRIAYMTRMMSESRLFTSGEVRDKHLVRAAKMAGLYAVAFSSGYNASERNLLIEDGYKCGISAMKDGTCYSLAGAAKEAGIPILTDALGPIFNPNYIESYATAKKCIYLVHALSSYFLDSTFVEETWGA